MADSSTLNLELDKRYPFPVPFRAHRDKIRGGLLVTLELTEDLPRPVKVRGRMNGTRSIWNRWRREAGAGGGFGRPRRTKRRGRPGAGTGLPSVSNFHQLPVVLLQLPMMGSAQGHQIVEVGGNAVTPIPQVMQLGAVNRGVAPHAPPVPDGGGQPLRTVAQPLVATQP